MRALGGVGESGAGHGQCSGAGMSQQLNSNCGQSLWCKGPASQHLLGPSMGWDTDLGGEGL